MKQMLDASVSMSIDSDSYTAGRNVAKDALQGMKTKPKLAVLAVDGLTRKKYKYPEILRGIGEILGPDVVLVGSTVNGMYVNDRFALKSVGLMLIGGDFNIDFTYNMPKCHSQFQQIGESILQKGLALPPSKNRFLLMFHDGVKFPPAMFEQQKMLNSRVVRLLTGLVSRVFKKQFEDFQEKGMGFPTAQETIDVLFDNNNWNTQVIGNVASNLRDYDSFEFFNNQMLEDASIGAMLSWNEGTKFNFGFEAGAEPTGMSCVPTKAIGSFILNIDNKPALQGFCDAINFDKSSLEGLKYNGYVNIWNIIGTRDMIDGKERIHLQGTLTNPELENLVMASYPFSKVPPKFEIFRSNPKILFNTVEMAVKNAMNGINDPKFLLGFDCMARFSAYGDNFPRIIKLVGDTIGKDTPRMIVGAGGEIFGAKKNDFHSNAFTFVTIVGGK